jgi:hypothetical protein
VAKIRQVHSGLVYLEMKTDRAKKHLDELNVTLADFVKNAYTITSKDHGKKRLHIVRFEFNPMPESIALLAGEFAYALRSGLDQLAWQLAFLKTSPKRPRTHTCFPIWSAPAPKKSFASTDAVRDILPAAIPVIEGLQPYNRGTDFKLHPLYLLNELCILDKHAVVPVKASDAKISFNGAGFLKRRELYYGFELIFDLSDKYKVKFDPIRPEIIFGEPIDMFGNVGLEMRIADLGRIYDFVRNEVIPRFSCFFPKR